MKKIFVFLAVVLTAGTLSGQTLLPNDPAVRTGKLENGLTYYIRHNDKPAQRAEFYLATNVGAIQETPDQDGLAHFLEHMCFNGTKNLPGKQMLDYLQKIGAEFGRNINAATGVEQTTYMLNNIPIVREGVIDTCLLIMHDYSHYVTCDPVEIDKERGVIIEEKRTRNDARWRMMEKSKPYYYGDTKYATCSLIGSQENLENFKPESLWNFYKTWYRPDLQAVIVVGDVDVDQIETKIRNLFGDIPAAENPQPKAIIEIPDNQEPMVGIITDPEASNTQVEVLWRSKPLPEELNSTDVGFTMQYIKTLMGIIMGERFNDISSAPDAPFIGASLGMGELCETCEAVFGRISCRNGESLSSFRAFMTEVEKMRRYGFSDGEVNRAKDELLNYFEEQAQRAESRKNADFVDSYINHFFDNYSYMEPQTELEVAKAVSTNINAQILSQVAAQAITNENMSIIYKAPEAEGLSHPAEADFLNVLNEVRASEIAANEAEDFDRELLDASTLKGSPVKKEKETIYGATEWILKNGLRVVVLPTEYEKNQVIMNLYMDGGESIIETEDLPSFEDNIFTLFLNNTGVGEFSGTDLPKILSGKTVEVSPFISSLSHGISASASPKDLETAFQLMYLTFMEPRFDQDEFNIGISQLKAVLPNVVNQPGFQFQAQITKTLFGDNPRKVIISNEVIGQANIQTVERVYRSMYNDVCGATLLIVGNVDLESLKPMVEKYAGSLTKGKKAHKWIDRGEDMVQGKVENHFEVRMETPKSTAFQVYNAQMPYSIENVVMMDAVKYILDMIYVSTLREEEGGTYGASINCSVSSRPKEKATISVYFDTNPESAEKLLKIAREGLYKLMEEGPTEEQLNMTIENFKKNLPESRISNGYWLQNLRYFYDYGTDFDQAYEAAIAKINAENIKEVLKAVLSQDNEIELLMSPAQN